MVPYTSKGCAAHEPSKGGLCRYASIHKMQYQSTSPYTLLLVHRRSMCMQRRTQEYAQCVHDMMFKAARPRCWWHLKNLYTQHAQKCQFLPTSYHVLCASLKHAQCECETAYVPFRCLSYHRPYASMIGVAL